MTHMLKKLPTIHDDRFCLRNAKNNELDLIMFFYRSYIGSPGCTWDDSYPNSDILQYDYQNGYLYTLHKDDELIGAISISAENYMDDLPCWRCKEKAKEISRVVIAKNHRGNRYGVTLINMTLSLLRQQGAEAVHLLVSPDNHHACNLYYNSGFVSRGKYFLYEHDYLALEKIF